MARSPQSLPGRQTVSYYLLGLTALSGEFPSDQLSRLPGGDAYKTNVVQTLKQKRLLHVFQYLSLPVGDAYQHHTLLYALLLIYQK